jgi:uncharacterized protein (UPF0305 family)
MSDETPVVRITMRELYDAIVRIDQKVTTLTQGREHDSEQRDAMNERIDDIERTLEKLNNRVMAWPSMAGLAAIVAIIVAVLPRFTT